MFSFLYNKLYKKIILILLALFICLPYTDEFPYPLILDVPKSNEINITEEWKKLKYPATATSKYNVAAKPMVQYITFFMR